MKVTGVVTEYNPFHFGHKYQLDRIKENSDAIIAIMSGPFVQRGEAAVTDKWNRAKAALLNGADLVVELPIIYALNTAQKFAFGAVDILNRIGIVDELCFGSECGDAEILKAAAYAIEHETPDISAKIKSLVKTGLSYPAARGKAFGDIIPDGVLSEPNNILAIEYIRAIMRFNSSITPTTIKREGAGYHDTATTELASASGIRKRIFSGHDFNLPISDFPIYDTRKLDTAVTAALRTYDEDSLSQINGVSEGLENRILRAAICESTIDSIAAAVKTKRYTMTRIKRILISALIKMTKNITEQPVNYLRILGMNSTGMTLLRQIKKNSAISTVIKAADYCSNDPVFNLDIRAQNIFSLCGEKKTGNEDFTTSPVIIK